MDRGNQMRLDARESAFFAREAEYVKASTYDAKPPALKGLRLVPQAADIPQGVSEITWRRFMEAGEAKIIADYAKDFPRVDAFGEEFTVKVHDVGASYGYSIPEIRASMRAGTRLDQRRAVAARNSIERRLNRLTLLSDRAAGTCGVLDFPGVTEATLPADGKTGGKSWADKLASGADGIDKILRDISVLTDAVTVPTNGAEEPDTLLLPRAAWNLLNNTKYRDATLMTWIRNNHPEFRRIEWLNELGGLGAGRTDRIMVGCFDAQHVENQIAGQFEQFDAQQEGLEFTIPCLASTAGVIVYYPMAFAYADGV